MNQFVSQSVMNNLISQINNIKWLWRYWIMALYDGSIWTKRTLSNTCKLMDDSGNLGGAMNSSDTFRTESSSRLLEQAHESS